MLVRPRDLTIDVGWAFQKRKIRAEFQLGGVTYNLGITDPKIKEQYIPLGTGSYRATHDAVMCVSLGEPFNGHRYKLAASIVWT